MVESDDEVVLSDQLITEKLKKHLRPDESELYYVFGQEAVSAGRQFLLWALLSLFLASALSTKNYFIGLTNQRLLLLHVSLTYEEKSLESVEISDIGADSVVISDMLSRKVDSTTIPPFTNLSMFRPPLVSAILRSQEKRCLLRLPVMLYLGKPCHHELCKPHGE